MNGFPKTYELSRKRVITMNGQVGKLIDAHCFAWARFWHILPFSFIFAGVAVLFISNEPLHICWTNAFVFIGSGCIWQGILCRWSRRSWLKALQRELERSLQDEKSFVVGAYAVLPDGIWELMPGEGEKKFWSYDKFSGVMIGRHVLLLFGQGVRMAFFEEDGAKEFLDIRRTLKAAVPVCTVSYWHMQNYPELY